MTEFNITQMSPGLSWLCLNLLEDYSFSIQASEFRSNSHVIQLSRYAFR